jgi:RNA polymerase sigma factor (sigma-70 family)
MRRSDFEPLYDTHAGRLFSFFLFRTGDRGLAEDLVADAFERALRARRRFDPKKGSEATWLYAIALNCVRDHWRKERSRNNAMSALEEESDNYAPAVGEQVERSAIIQQALEGLSSDERDAIALRFGGDLTVKEMSELTGEAFTTVQGRLYRGIRKLRRGVE